MKKLTALLLLSAFVLAAKDKATDSVTITSTPPGATVEWNRKVIGKTPLVFKVGEYAFNARKSTAFAKRLSQPVMLKVTMEGFAAKEETITKEMVWTSYNGRTRFAFYVIGFTEYDYKLDKVSAAPSVLSNSGVVEMWAAGFGEELIAEKIKGSATAFTLELADMVALRESGIPDGVIKAMMQKGAKP